MAEMDKNRIYLEEICRQEARLYREKLALMAERGDSLAKPDNGFYAVEHMIGEVLKEGKQELCIAYQGMAGAYQEAAAEKFFQGIEEKKLYPVATFKDTVLQVFSGEADFGIIPIENSYAGQVSDTYDLLAEAEVFIVGEVYIPIEHALLGCKGAKLTEIRRVYSHLQAFAQCEHFLEDYPEWGKIPMSNTALAAKVVSADGNTKNAAIASLAAARIYGLEVLKAGIQDSDANATRFVVICKRKLYEKSAKKVSIVFELPDKAGTLYDALGHVIHHGLNMIKIESRPLREKAWRYRFFVDIEGNLQEQRMVDALHAMCFGTENLRVLGCY